MGDPRGPRSKTVTQTREASADPSREVASNPLYGVAMLKIAMELKKPDAGALDDILRGVLERMHLSETEFRGFLAQNQGLLRSLAQKKFT